jgi:hypothetical protein
MSNIDYSGGTTGAELSRAFGKIGSNTQGTPTGPMNVDPNQRYRLPTQSNPTGMTNMGTFQPVPLHARAVYDPGQPGGYQGYNPGMTVQDMTRGMQAGAPIGGGGSQGAALMPYSMKPQGGFGNQQNMVRAMHDALMGGGTF